MALRSGDLAAYHGVEHKAIAAYEDDGDAADADKEHDRCGSHLVAPMLAARRGGQRGRAPGRPARPGGRGRRGARQRGRGGGGLRLVRAPRRQRARPRCCASPATRSSAWWARASPPRSSSRSGARRSPRSCASKAARLTRWPPRPARARASTRRSSACPSSGSATGYYTDAYFNLTKELLEARGPPPARDDAGVPEAATRCSAGSTRRSPCSSSARARHGEAWERGWDELDVHALYEGDEIAPFETVMTDRGRLLAVRAPGDRLPRAAWPAAASSCGTCARWSRPRTASRSCSSPPATTTGSCRPATAGPRTWPGRSACPPTPRRRGGAGAAWARCRTG